MTPNVDALVQGIRASMLDQYAKSVGAVGPDYDYGLAKGGADSREHYTDAGKLPGHPTFSNQSAYSTDKYPGGVWSKDANGRDVFTPSKAMMEMGAGRGLAGYFAKVEPNATVQYPPFKSVDAYYENKR